MDNKKMPDGNNSDANVRISANLLKEMAGKLSVGMSEDKNEELMLEIPFDIYDADGNLKIHAEPESDFDFSGCRALLISDDEKCRNRTFELMELVNIRSDWVTAMDKGIEQFQKQPAGSYQLIFVNIKQLNRKAYEFAGKVRQYDAQIPIFAVTDIAFSRTVLDEFKAEIDEYFVKPLDAKRLYDKLKKYLKK